jgi:hypothetical protein
VGSHILKSGTRLLKKWSRSSQKVDRKLHKKWMVNFTKSELVRFKKWMKTLSKSEAGFPQKVGLLFLKK